MRLNRNHLIMYTKLYPQGKALLGRWWGTRGSSVIGDGEKHVLLAGPLLGGSLPETIFGKILIKIPMLLSMRSNHRP